MLCPCGSNKHFSLCCQPFITLQQLPHTPEQLMRSRFSAYVKGAADYIYQTYAKSSQQQQSLSEITQWAAMSKWLFLEIHHSCDTPQAGHDYPEVTFSAHYLLGNKYHILTETSRFLRENDQWRYLDGDISDADPAKEIKRNDLCPCRSLKKFKQCCGR